jgi:lipid-A-disaccharide synthase
VPPETWALPRWAVRRIARDADVIAPLFPNQVEQYRACGGEVRWVGHPAAELLAAWARPRPSPGHAPTVGLFPGSRRVEVLDLLPVLREAAAILRRSEPGARFVMCAANEVVAPLIRRDLGSGWPVPVELEHGNSHAVLARCDLLLTCSGTATLEAAILGVPMVVIYRLHHWLDRLLQVWFLRRSAYPFFALPNYLLGRAVVPELRKNFPDPRRVAAEGLALLRDPVRRRQVLEGLAEVREMLGPPGSIGRVADLVEELLGASRPMRMSVCHAR